MFNIQDFFGGLFQTEVTLGADGVWAPSISAEQVVASMSEAFSGDISNYYCSQPEMERFIEVSARYMPAEPKNIICLCGGYGVEAFVLAKRHPGARILITDLSRPMMAAAAAEAARQGLSERVIALQMDALAPVVNPGCFDIVLGMRALHHMLDPAAAMIHIGRLTATGGAALLCEPLVVGYVLLAQTHTAILADTRAGALHPEARRYLETMRLCWETMLDQSKTAKALAGLDDKWCFPKTKVTALAGAVGFTGCRFIISEVFGGARFVAQTKATIETVCGEGGGALLPGWAWELIANLDRLAAYGLDDELASNALIVMNK